MYTHKYIRNYIWMYHLYIFLYEPAYILTVADIIINCCPKLYPTSSVRMFQFLYIFATTWYCLFHFSHFGEGSFPFIMCLFDLSPFSSTHLSQPMSILPLICTSDCTVAQLVINVYLVTEREVDTYSLLSPGGHLNQTSLGGKRE